MKNAIASLIAVLFLFAFAAVCQDQTSKPVTPAYLVHYLVNGTDAFAPFQATADAEAFINAGCMLPAQVAAIQEMPLKIGKLGNRQFVELLKVSIVEVKVDVKSTTTVPEPVTVTTKKYTVTGK